mmetsp:Transcript_68545/g.200520  ORF Transcript_68545/g.200520 Transcript_68545/m.200520 type:complete len:869 (-) Transcript_68545:93-2699(-)
MSHARPLEQNVSEEEDSDYEDETEMSSEDDVNFERIVALEDTPWAEFVMCTGQLMMLIAAFLFVQMIWTLQLKSYIDVAYLPVSIILVPAAFWWLRRSRWVSFQRVQGIEYILHFVLRGNRCRQSDYVAGTSSTNPMNSAQTLGDQIKEAFTANEQKGRMGYNLGLGSCIVVFWMLLVGQSCWPFGYMYLTHYSFARCQYACQEMKMSNTSTGVASTFNSGDAFRLTIQSKSAQARTYLIGNCSKGLGFESHKAFPSEVFRRFLDPHWFIQPAGAWVLGQPLQGLHFHYNASERYGFFDETDCSRLYTNNVILTIIILLVLAVAAVTFVSHQNVVLSSGAMLLSLLCSTGIGKVWVGAIGCRRSSLNSHDLVFTHLLHSCISVVTYNGTTSFGSSMRSAGNMLAAYESNFRHAHQISRSEVHFGYISEVLVLALVIAAHTTFRYKRVQTRGARLHILCGRPRLFLCMLDHLEFLDSLPHRDRLATAHHLHMASKEHEGKIQDLQQRIDAMMARNSSYEDLDVASSSFWPAMLYAFVRALIPSIYRQFIPIHGKVAAVPEYNTLWMLNAVSVMMANILVYLFALFQVQEATRRYTRCMQMWLLFDNSWNFPSQTVLAGDALTETVQVQVQEEEEVVKMLDISRSLIGDFSYEHASSEAHRDDDLVNIQMVREKLPIWWSWREYLIIDYTDKKVRLEFHLVVVFVMLLMSVGQIFADWSDQRVELSGLRDADGTIRWFGSHVTTLTFQTAWDVLSLMVPLLHAIHCAVTMNHLIESQLQKVLHLEEVIGSASCDRSSEAGGGQSKADVGAQVRNIFSMARSELDRGGSVTMLLCVCKINKQLLAIIGTVLSVFGGGQAVEIWESLRGAAA